MVAAAEAHAQHLPAPAALHDPNRHIRPLHDRILVRRMPHLRKVGLIILVGNNAKEQMEVARVIAIGPRVTLRPWELRVDDFVMYPRMVGAKYDSVLGRFAEEGDLVFLQERELIAVCDPSIVVASATFRPNPRDGTLELDPAGL
jgi:co-chaperonin GroES (HSP10)